MINEFPWCLVVSSSAIVFEEWCNKRKQTKEYVPISVNSSWELSKALWVLNAFLLGGEGIQRMRASFSIQEQRLKSLLISIAAFHILRILGRWPGDG